ncbi:MAG TPA: hypothetical protein VGG41_05925 [Solirubrobacteraceae bacterium]
MLRLFVVGCRFDVLAREQAVPSQTGRVPSRRRGSPRAPKRGRSRVEDEREHEQDDPEPDVPAGPNDADDADRQGDATRELVDGFLKPPWNALGPTCCHCLPDSTSRSGDRISA